ncbi:carbohydrate ABC transporter permease [Haploplasma axanthum]|nr:sugar ABC transporter permease [Haploplasma axanthum]
MKKIKRFLTNNWLIKVNKNDIVFFNKFKYLLTNKRRNAFQGYMFVGVWIIGFLLFAAYPLISSLIYSFEKVSITGSDGIVTNFIGFSNYVRIFTQDLEFLRHLQEFFLELILYVPVILIISMIIAMMLNQKIKLRGFFRSIYFLPVVIASGPVINELLSQGAGSIPLIEEIGLTEAISSILPAFLSKPIASLFTQMIMILWFSGVQIVLFLAGLQKVGNEIYEAADIDGASSWEKFWKITLPSLKSIIFVSAIYTVVMLATFSNNQIVKYIQSSGVMFNTDKGFGYSSALAWIYFIMIIIVLGFIAFLLRGKKDEKVVKKRGGKK